MTLATSALRAPGWFARLVALPIESHELAVVINGVKVGDVQIVGEPGDEIAEFWDNVVAMAATVALLNVAMVGILYILFGRVLDPLTILAAASRTSSGKAMTCECRNRRRAS